MKEMETGMACVFDKWGLTVRQWTVGDLDTIKSFMKQEDWFCSDADVTVVLYLFKDCSYILEESNTKEIIGKRNLF